ncbi:class I SAM-dependent methyltransferase [Vibrio sp.]|uniref:class I SAM-dependent methyltransferase n=1 Tax=Vibrio sp. TaxID=678 RepID=UPI003D0B3ED3
MTELTLQELETVAKAYEQFLTPVLFTKWTHRLADLAEIQPGQQALDVACGTGTLTRVIAERAGNRGKVSGIDVNPGMLAVANKTNPNIEWLTGNAEALPFDDASFDAVLCQFGLMLFASPETALQEMRRVLRPGGRLVVAVFGSLDELPAYAALAGVYDRVVDQSVGNALRMPFSMGHKETLMPLFASAGIHSAQIISATEQVCFPSVRNMVLADVKGWFPFAGIHLDKDTVDSVTDEAQNALKSFQTSEGRVEFEVPVRIVLATAADSPTEFGR